METKIPLILVSGLLCNELVWTHQIRHLNDLAAIKVICPSQETPQKMVEEILNRAPNRFALAGHSMGGWICLELMRHAPERVIKLCLLNTTAKPDTPIKKAKRKEMIQTVENGQFSKIVDELVNNFVYKESIKERVRKMLFEVGKQAFIRQEKSMLLRSECQSILPTIRCPTLVIHAENDKIFTLDDHQEIANHVINSKLSILEDCGHMSSMEKPEIITSLLRSWLVN